MICVGVGFGSVGGGGLISIGMILVGNDVVSGCSAWVWWCNDLGSRCSGVGLVFDRGLLWVFFFFDSRLCVASGGGGGGVRYV